MKYSKMAEKTAEVNRIYENPDCFIVEKVSTSYFGETVAIVIIGYTSQGLPVTNVVPVVQDTDFAEYPLKENKGWYKANPNIYGYEFKCLSL